jgi:hypothetical protein
VSKQERKAISLLGRRNNKKHKATKELSTTVSNVPVTSNSAGVTHLLNTITVMQIVPHHRITRATS